MQDNTPPVNHNSDTYFLIAFGLINILGFTLLFCTLGLLIGITISVWEFPLACVAGLLTTYFASVFLLGKKANGSFLKNGVLIIVLLVVSILAASSVYDASFDGEWYHQETVYRLKNGYNPAHQFLPVPADEQLIDNSNNWCESTAVNTREKPGVILTNLKFLNMNHFSKGGEIIEASIYQVTNRIESGKAANAIILFASFFLSLSLLYKVDRIGIKTKWLLAFILSFNPVSVKELFTYCVDGFGGSLLLCLLLTFCLLLLQPNRNRNYYYLLGCLLILTVNVKFTMLVFACIYMFGFLLVMLIFKKTGLIKNTLITASVAMIIGVFCCGFNPYVTNTVQKHDLFYGLDATRVEIKRLTPTPFLTLNRFETLFLSLTSHQSWDLVDKSTVSQIPKIPFTVNKNDILSSDVEPGISAFGPFYSGSMLTAIMILVIAIIYWRKTQAFKYAVLAILIILVTVLIIPDPWWMRFVPQLWLIPIIVLVMAEFISFKANKILKVIVYVSLILNIGCSMVTIVFVVFNTARVNYQMAQIKAIGKPINLEFCNYRCFKTNKVRLEEAGITITDKPIINGKVYDINYSTSKFITAAPLAVIPKSALLKLSEKLGSK